MTCLQYVIWAGEPLQILTRYAIHLTLSAFSCLRTFALSKSYPVALLVFLLSSVSVGVAFVSESFRRSGGATIDRDNVQSDFRFDLVGVNIPLLGCTATTTVSSELFKKFAVILYLAPCCTTDRDV